jgi:hypothetical protein
VFRAATSAYGLTAGLIALSAFGLNLLSPRLATLVRTDMPLALVIFLIGLSIWRKIQKEEAWRLRDQVYVFALLTGAMLIKGPIVYAFLLPGIAIFQWHARGGTRAVVSVIFGRRQRGRPPSYERADAQMAYNAWCGWWPWIASLAIFLLWAIGGVLFQSGFFDEVVMREFVGRFGETIHRPQPLYFYLPHLLHKFAPWSVLMIAIAVLDLRSREWRLRSVFREMSPESFWLLCWSLGGLIAMSLIPSKRVDRIFPIIPPLCLLLAAQIARCVSYSHSSASRRPTNIDYEVTDHPPSRGSGAVSRPVATENRMRDRIYLWSAIALILSICVTGGYTVSKVISGYRDHRDALVVFGTKVRHEAEVHHWRYEVVSAKDEGMLLYLRKTHFIEPDRAIAEWNLGNLDALVAPAEKPSAVTRELRDAVLSQLKSNGKKSEQGRGYILITR